MLLLDGDSLLLCNVLRVEQVKSLVHHLERVGHHLVTVVELDHQLTSSFVW